jgi:predicted nuclease of predicted toxin-antitoxin system
MRFKIDENMHALAAAVLAEAGHDALTVADQGLAGSPDGRIAEVIRREDRCLVTLDLDFANIIAYPPESYPGLIVMRLPRALLSTQLALARQVALHLSDLPLRGRLWIVEPGRIRIHEPDGGPP